MSFIRFKVLSATVGDEALYLDREGYLIAEMIKETVNSIHVKIDDYGKMIFKKTEIDDLQDYEED